jgi:hypothetical protein
MCPIAGRVAREMPSVEFDAELPGRLNAAFDRAGAPRDCEPDGDGVSVRRMSTANARNSDTSLVWRR